MDLQNQIFEGNWHIYHILHRYIIFYKVQNSGIHFEHETLTFKGDLSNLTILHQPYSLQNHIQLINHQYLKMSWR